jgi:hypothetical protein
MLHDTVRRGYFLLLVIVGSCFLTSKLTAFHFEVGRFQGSGSTI